MENENSKTIRVGDLAGGKDMAALEKAQREERELLLRTKAARVRRIKARTDAEYHPVQWCSVCHEDQRPLVILNFVWTEVALCSGCLVEARRRVTQQLGLRVQLP